MTRRVVLARVRTLVGRGPWLELGLVFLSIAVVMLVQQGRTREHQGQVRTDQINALTVSLGELRQQVALLQAQGAVKDATNEALAKALIARGGDPAPILRLQQEQNSRLMDPAATPTRPASPTPQPTAQPTPSPRPSARPSPAPRPTPTRTPSPAPSPTCVRLPLLGCLPRSTP